MIWEVTDKIGKAIRICVGGQVGKLGLYSVGNERYWEFVIGGLKIDHCVGCGSLTTYNGDQVVYFIYFINNKKSKSLYVLKQEMW